MSRRTKRTLIILSVFVTLATAAWCELAQPKTAHADPVACNGPVLAFDRQRWCGYFRNIGFDEGEDVRLGGVPGSVNTAQEFINLVIGDLNSGNTQRITGAQFIILTMIGAPGGSPKTITPAQQADWEARVRSYASTSENGTQSFGPNGRIDWNVSLHTPCNIVNTYYQVGQNDVAPFRDTPANSDCENPSVFNRFILFRDTNGNQLYMIRRICMNPMGGIGELEKYQPQFNLNPTISTTVSGIPATTAEVGDTVRFSYAVNNTGPDPSVPVSCTIYANVHNGYFAPVAGSPTSGSNPPGYVPPSTGCPRVFPLGETPLAFEAVVIAVDDRTICRSLFVSPASQTVTSRGFEACVQVVRKPYVKVFGGDVSAGNGLMDASGSCTGSASSIVAWNKGTPGFAGAGVQYAAYALANIREFATASGNAAGASAPSGLAFANAGAVLPPGAYGGSFGTVPCTPDYYAKRPAVTTALPPTVAAIPAGGVYGAVTDRTLGGGTLAPGTRVSVYVDGDVYITGDIMYGGSWASDNVPMFRLIVKGNIYIDRNVGRLDGMYVAQPDGGVGGRIYTCATSGTPLTPDAALASNCGKLLTINGAFTAERILLLRTNGSLRQSVPGENSASATMAEKFNYSPALWMAQPVNELPETPQYDSITSLPPIL